MQKRPRKRTPKSTLSEVVSPFAFCGETSFFERGVPSPERLIPTRLTAEATQLRPLVEPKDVGVEVRSPAFAKGVAACDVDATVGDIKRGELLYFGVGTLTLAMFSSSCEVRVVDVFVRRLGSRLRPLTLLA